MAINNVDLMKDYMSMNELMKERIKETDKLHFT